MDKPETIIAIDYEKCSPCSGLVCVGVCPLGILEADKGKKPRVVDVASCTQCAVCSNLCPLKAITVKRKASNEQLRG